MNNNNKHGVLKAVLWVIAVYHLAFGAVLLTGFNVDNLARSVFGATVEISDQVSYMFKPLGASGEPPGSSGYYLGTARGLWRASGRLWGASRGAVFINGPKPYKASADAYRHHDIIRTAPVKPPLANEYPSRSIQGS